jgi:catechol 2,3-dioxygenase-like lactoylglutathione lyase family enzyme
MAADGRAARSPFGPLTPRRTRCGSVRRAVLDVERVDFVSVPTRDASRARRFYTDVLGLPPSEVNPDELETPNVTLALWQPEAEGVPFAPNTAGIALRVPDVEAARARLSARGVEFLGETVDTGVCLMAFFYDPDGNVLILHRRYAPP